MTDVVVKAADASAEAEVKQDNTLDGSTKSVEGNVEATTEVDPSKVESTEQQPVMSKSQRKKLEREKKFAEYRKYCRAKQHEKRRLKRNHEKKLARERELAAEGTDLTAETDSQVEAKRQRVDSAIAPKKSNKPDLSVPPKIRVVFDCSFDADMTEHDVRKLINQIGQAYGANRKTNCMAEMHICGVNGKLESLTSKRADVHRWSRVSWRKESFLEAFAEERSNLVYLTSESETTLDSLSSTDLYVIGGLVDHNRLKGHCHGLATQNNLRTARLPISSNLRLASSAVLSVYHVFAILLRQLEVNDWRKALVEVIPKRKVVEVRNTDANSEEDDSSLDEEELKDLEAVEETLNAVSTDADH